MNGLEVLKKIEKSYQEQKRILINDPFIHLHERMWFLTIEKELKALDILTKSLALEMSVDEDYAVLFVKIPKDKLCIVGSVKGKENIEPLKAVMKYYEEVPQFTDQDREKLIKELNGEVFRVK